jgi:hypothetical protein
LKNQKTYDIRGTKDHGFIGAIGEAIAWQYLWDKGISSHALGAARSAFEGVGPKDRSRLERNLTQEQIDFIFPPLNLEEFLQHQSERSRSRGSTEEEIRQDEQHWLDLWESWTDSRDSLSWDFVGYSREWPVKQGKACLVEVKTSRPGKQRGHSETKGRKGMAPEDLREATRLGFVMMLVTVELTDTWEAIVSEQEILADT